MSVWHAAVPSTDQTNQVSSVALCILNNRPGLCLCHCGMQLCQLPIRLTTTAIITRFSDSCRKAVLSRLAYGDVYRLVRSEVSPSSCHSLRLTLQSYQLSYTSYIASVKARLSLEYYHRYISEDFTPGSRVSLA